MREVAIILPLDVVERLLAIAMAVEGGVLWIPTAEDQEANRAAIKLVDREVEEVKALSIAQHQDQAVPPLSPKPEAH